MVKRRQLNSFQATSTPMRTAGAAPPLESVLSPFTQKARGLLRQKVHTPEFKKNKSRSSIAERENTPVASLRAELPSPKKNVSKRAAQKHGKTPHKRPGLAQEAAPPASFSPVPLSPVAATVNASVASKKRRSSIIHPAHYTSNSKLGESGVKKRRFRPGTKALMEIRRYQKTFETLIPRAPFGRVVAEVMQELGAGDYRIQRLALEALQEAAEAYVVFLMEASTLTSIHARRVTLMPKDMRLVRRIRGDYI